MPLALIKEGTVASIVRMGGKEEVKRHLEGIGFVPGVSVIVVSANNGSVIINVKELRIAISKEMASKIVMQASRGYEKERSVNKIRTLKEVKCKNTVTIVKLHGEGAVERRIIDMDITKETEAYVRKVAPLGDPMEVNVRGCELSLRKVGAEMTEVQQKLPSFERMS